MPIVMGGVIFAPQIANAAASCSWWMIFSEAGLAECAAVQGGNLFIGLLSTLGEAILQMMSWLVGIAGIVLNMSIVFTLNIKTIYEATPAIEQVWIVIRNISSIFIIFALLFTAIKTILGVKGPNFGSLVARIFMAGILINFSLFFTRVAIDASNLVSMQFYRAIVPASQNIDLSQGNPQEALKNVLKTSFSEGGLSNVFQQSLKLPKIYHDKGGLLRTANSVFLIAVSTIGGSILMFTAALSFFFAGLAFIARLVILLLIMGFSPLFFVGIIFPKVDSNLSSKWKEYFIPQLTFMPVYLLFMYVALMFLSSGGFFQALDDAQKNAALGATGNGAYLLSDVGLIFQFIIAFFLINIPLIAALKVGGESTAWANSVTNKIKGYVGGAVGRNTLGRAGKFAGEQFDNMAASNFAQTGPGKFATSTFRALGISQAVRGGLAGVEGGKYGSKQNLADVKKEDKDRQRVIAGVQRENARSEALRPILNNLPTTPAQLTKYYDAVNKMTKKELEDTPLKVLKNTQFAATLSSKQVEGITDGDFLTEVEKEEFKEARKTGLTTIFNSGRRDVIEKHMKNITGKELAKVEPTILQKTEVMDHMRADQLKEMEDTIDRNTRRTIGNYIAGLPATTQHKAYGYMSDHNNRTRWTA